MELYENIKEKWEWIQKIKRIARQESANIRETLLKECLVMTKKKEDKEDFFEQKISFPSTTIKNIALREFKFEKNVFSFLEVLNHILANMDLLNKNNTMDVFVMLTDISLFEIYNIFNQEFQSDFFTQLNRCIILDAMKIKPINTDIAADLKEVSEKAEMNIGMLDKCVIWAIAMLNYKTHVYQTAISFFQKFLFLCEREDNPGINHKKLHARIYIGYCNEKKNNPDGFEEAIKIFEELLLQIKGNQEYENLVTELHHGLGHFYNEKAIFGRSYSSEDLINARRHMRKALEQKSDYYSCFGSLFNEFGDYESADKIFHDAMGEETIQNNEELRKEMNFYIGQTDSALVSSEKKQHIITVTEKNFNVFEEYCKRTFNFDGIVHARIFKIRANLRQVRVDKMRCNRRRTREQLLKWYNELTEYPLSSYASKAIKEEYRKTVYILKTFQSFYAGDSFVWHIEDVQYNLHKFINLMPPHACELDISVQMAKEDVSSNLYCMQLGQLRIWCVSSLELKRVIRERRICFPERLDDVKNVPVYPVINKEEAHRCIQKNGKPDLVVLIPPAEKDRGFEQEVNSIMDVVDDSYFVFTSETSNFYTIEWLKDVASGKRQVQYYTNTVTELLKVAYCFRAFEILWKELLQPIPLFSLAPTHFSSSYDFQLGENLSIQLDYMNKQVDGEAQKEIRNKLEYAITKFNLERKDRVTAAAEAMNVLCCNDERAFSACFPHPCADKEDNYISYLVCNKTLFSKELFLHKVIEGEVYTIKALPSYRTLFWKLQNLLNKYGCECDQVIEDECVAHYDVLLTDDNDISTLCRKLLEMIFLEKIEMLKHPYKCILRKGEKKGRECYYIYMILLSDSEQKQGKSQDELEGKEGGCKKVKPSVFVTYAWEPENTEFVQYQKEVLDFTNELRDHEYDATFDLVLGKSNWTQTMIDGLQKDKIIVLLSSEYKRKADKTIGTGVQIETNAILNRLKSGDGSVIFAKLLSQKDRKVDDVLPVIFSGEKVIDLSKDDDCISDGYNMLYLRLNNEEIADLHPIGNAKRETKKL